MGQFANVNCPTEAKISGIVPTAFFEVSLFFSSPFLYDRLFKLGRLMKVKTLIFCEVHGSFAARPLRWDES